MVRQAVKKSIALLSVAICLLSSIQPVAAVDRDLFLPGLVYATVAQSADIGSAPVGEGVKLSSKLPEIIVSVRFAEDVYNRVVETRLYQLKNVDDQPIRLSISAGWEKGRVFQTTPFAKPLNIERWPEGPYEARIYVDSELLKVIHFELLDDMQKLPNTPRDATPVFDFGSGRVVK